jgi:hypothetical protein
MRLVTLCYGHFLHTMFSSQDNDRETLSELQGHSRVAFQSLFPYFVLLCCVVPFLRCARCCLFKVGGCLFDETARHSRPGSRREYILAFSFWCQNSVPFFGLENRWRPGWLWVSRTETAFSVSFREFSGIVIIIIIIIIIVISII